MKNRISLSTMVLLFAFSSAALSTTDGGRPGTLLEWGVGGRSLGMGKAQVAAVNDASAAYWNPAVLPLLTRQEAGMMHAILWNNTNIDTINYVYPFSQRQGAGISIERIAKDDFELRNDFNELLGSFGVSETSAKIAYGQSFSKKISFGASVNYLNRSVSTSGSSLFGADLGALYQFVDGTRGGVKAENLLAFQDSSTDDKLDMVLRAGVAKDMFKKKLTGAVDLDSNGRWYAGFEAALYATFFRFGINSDELSAGVGLQWRGMKLDYAIAQQDLGLSHRIWYGIQWGADRGSERKKMAASLDARGTQLIVKGQMNRALDSFEQSLNLNTTPETEKRYTKLKNLMNKGIARDGTGKLSTDREREIARLKNEAVASYVNGQPAAALRTAHRVLGTVKDDAEMRALSDLLASEGVKADDEYLPDDAQVAVKLHRTVQNFNDKKYDLVVKDCVEVLEIDPNNALAYTRLGSAYYALGLKNKALEAWRKALSLNPDIPELQEFLKEIKE